VINTLIVDDEPLAREGIRLALKGEADVRIVGEAADGEAALNAMEKLAPDLMFLDIRMPGLNGFDVLARASHSHTRMPVIVFVTAFDRYAVKAFEANALDYLLKPVEPQRLRAAVERTRAELAKQEIIKDAKRRAMDLQSVEERPVAPRSSEPLARAEYLDRVAVRVRDRFLLIKMNDVDWIESAANYVQLHSRSRSFLLRMTMGELEAKLDPHRFSRIHRSTIVNIDRLVEVKPSLHGDFDVVLQDGTTLRMSRGYREALLPR
jgi:two-component system LytT family response regulator